MKLEIGKTYKNKKGEVMKCTNEICDGLFLLELSEKKYFYTEDGEAFDPFPSDIIDYSEYNINEEIGANNIIHIGTVEPRYDKVKYLSEDRMRDLLAFIYGAFTKYQDPSSYDNMYLDLYNYVRRLLNVEGN